jgi:EAL domain-containing protein (putative c-di-GMP-specific phosphodiesterase class I)
MLPIPVSTDAVSPPPACGQCRSDQTLGFDFGFAYQPIVRLSTRSIYAHEALVRGPNGESAHSVLSQVTEQNR